MAELARLDDGALKVDAAQHAPGRVAAVTEQYSPLARESETIRNKHAEREELTKRQRSHDAALERLSERFIEMQRATNPQRRSGDLDTFLNDLFELWDLQPESRRIADPTSQPNVKGRGGGGSWPARHRLRQTPVRECARCRR